MRTQFLPLGGFALIMACSAGLGVANGGPDSSSLPPGTGVRTDTGIGVGDTVKQLRAAYTGRHIFYNDATPMKGNSEAYYGINGKRSHLVFYVDRGIIKGITLDPGLIDADHPVSGEGRGIAVCS